MTLTEQLDRSMVDVYNLTRHIRHEFARKAKLKSSEYETLLILRYGRKPMSVKELSSELLLSSQAITKILQKLVKRGYITSQKSEEDRRVTFSELTPAGMELAEIEYQARLRTLDLAMQHSNEENLHTTLKLCSTIKAMMQSTPSLI